MADSSSSTPPIPTPPAPMSIPTEQLATIVALAAAEMHRELNANPSTNPATVPPTPSASQTLSSSKSHRAGILASATSQLPKLTNDNYAEWESAITLAIQSVELWGYIEGSIVRLIKTDSCKAIIYLQEAGVVLNAIAGSLGNGTRCILDGVRTPREAWLAIRDRYHADNDARLGAVDWELVSLKLEEGGNAIEHIQTFCALRKQLEGTEFEMRNRRAISALFRSLPESYNSWTTNLEQASICNFKLLCTRLESHYHDRVYRSEGTGISAFPALQATGSDIYRPPNDLRPYLTQDINKNPALNEHAKKTCKDCLYISHNRGDSQCPQYYIHHQLWGPRRNIQRRPMAPGTNSRQVNLASTSGSEDIQAQAATLGISAGFPTFNAFAATTSGPIALTAGGSSLFLLDSGCQVHLTCIRSIFTRFKVLSEPIPISGIGNHQVMAMGRGRIALPVVIDKSLSWLELDGVLFAPQLGRNLLSTGALLDAGWTVTMGTTGASISSLTAGTIAWANYMDRLWTLNVDLSVLDTFSAPSANVATTISTWHKQFNHIGINAMQNLASKGIIPAITKDDLREIQNCEVCVLGKGVRLPFRPSTTPQAQKPLELVHSDLVCGIDSSIGGARYAATFLDNYSCMAWVFPLKTKDQLAQTFSWLCSNLELQSGHHIKTLRTDNGGEYMSALFAKYLADAGIIHQTTCANSSQSNGTVERFQRTTFNKVRCMLAHAGMAKGWWAEAILTATHVHNLTPNASLPNHVSPMSLWTNKPVSVSHLRVFGSVCYAIDTAKHRPKLGPRAVGCRLVGYEPLSKAYRLQVKGSVKVIKSRNVVFHEDKALVPGPIDEKSLLQLPFTPLVPGTESAMSKKLTNSVREGSDSKPRNSVGDEAEIKDEPDDSVGEEDTVPSRPPEPARPSRNKKKTWKLQEGAEVNIASAPKSYRQAMQGPSASEWSKVIDEEYKSWKDKSVYEVQTREPTMTVLPSMLLLSIKTDERGCEVRKKACCVVRGDMQAQSPEDRPAHISPVARLSTFRAIAAKVAITGCELQQMDVKTAFLHAPLKEPVYLSIPSGFPDSELQPGVARSEQVLKLNRAVYGLKEVPYSWYVHCANIFMTNGFVQSNNDQCLFSTTPPASQSKCYVLVYVDDFMILADTKEDMDWLKRKLTMLFDLKDLGAASQVLGIEILRDRTAGTLKMTQRKFIKQLLEEYNMSDCRPMDTPMFSNALSSLPSHTKPLTEEEQQFMRNKDFQYLLGCLNWLALGTRPDLAYTLSRLGQAQSNPHPEHWQALKHVLRYLSGTVDMGLVYSAHAKDTSPHVFTDSAFTDCPDTQKSHAGFVVLLGGAAISWSSRKQQTVTTSSTEAEYIAMGIAAKEAVWMRRLLNDLGFDTSHPMRIYADNQSSLLLANSEKLSSRTKHLDVQYHFVHELISQGLC